MNYSNDYGSAPPPYGGNIAYFPPPPPPPIPTATVIQPPTTVIYQATGNCPSCRQGILVSGITCLGVCCAIFFFPIGLICLFLLQEQRCPVCGYSSG